jgi:O-antigen ligase
MSQAVRNGSGASLFSTIWSDGLSPEGRIRNVDRLAVPIAMLLPWTTTGVAIAAVVWVIALLPTIERRALLASLRRPASALPFAFVVLVVLGMLWSRAPWDEQLHQLGQVAKLLVLPLLIYHFGRSPRGVIAFTAFLISCTVLSLVSCLVALDPLLSAKLYLSRGPFNPTSGIFVRNYIDQGQEFSLCAVALAYPAVTAWQEGRSRRALLLASLGLWLVVNLLFVITSRTALVTMPIMLAVFALMHLRGRVALALLCGFVLLAAIAWSTSHQMRETFGKFFTDYGYTENQNNETGIGSRLIYWGKSLRFLGQAPAIGHGTGSTRALFEQAAVGEKGARAMVVSDPHNQTLNVAIQWGLAGVALLWAMWLVHLALFRGEGLVAWIGLLVVVQNMLSSLINSHLFDFTEGWIYVLGVGVAAGMTLARDVSLQSPAPAGSESESASRSQP